MTAIAEDNVYGFFASFHPNENYEELVKQYLWGEKGLKETLKRLKWQAYGQDFHLILFEFYVNPIPPLRNALRAIGNYRRKEKAIGIPVVLDQENFFKLSERERCVFLNSTIISKLELLEVKIKRNKLDLNIGKLKMDTDKILQQL